MNLDLNTLRGSAIWDISFKYAVLLVNFILGILFVPIYLKYLSSDTYGAWLATGNILFLLSLIDPGIGLILTQKVSNRLGKTDFKSIGKLSLSGLFMSAIIVSVISIIGIIISFFISDLIGYSGHQELNEAFRIAIIGTACNIIGHALIAINRGLLNTFTPGLSILLGTIFYYLTVWLLLDRSFGIIAFGWASLSMPFFTIVINSVVFYFTSIKLELKPSFSNKIFRYLLYSSYYTFLMRLLNNAVENVDRVIVSRVFSPALVTSYGLTQLIPKTGGTVIERISVSLMPALANLKGRRDNINLQKIFDLYFKATILLILLYVSGIMIFIYPFMKLWVGKEFFMGGLILSVFLVNGLLMIIRNALSNYSISFGNIKSTSLVNFYQSLITVVAIVIGILFKHIILIALAPSVGIVIFGIRKLGLIVRDQLELDKIYLYSLTLYMLSNLIVVSILVVVFRFIKITSWIDLLLWVILYICCFILIIGFKNKTLLKNIRDLIRK